MYIFLDIDGVLVKESQDEEEYDSLKDLCKLDQTCRDLFEDVIRRHPEVKIVIASSWREIFDFDMMRSAFSDDIGQRIEGATPFYSNATQTTFFRYHEVIEYLSHRNAADEPWIAIDDIAEHYPDTVPIVLTDPYVGFDATAVMELDALLGVDHSPVAPPQ